MEPSNDLIRQAIRRHSRAASAWANYRWLASLNSGVLLPDLVHSDETAIAFTKLDGPTPGTGDLVMVAATIGRLQRAAGPELATARLDRPHSTGTHGIKDFTESRRAALHAYAAIVRAQVGILTAVKADGDGMIVYLIAGSVGTFNDGSHFR